MMNDDRDSVPTEDMRHATFDRRHVSGVTRESCECLEVLFSRDSHKMIGSRSDLRSRELAPVSTCDC